MKHIRKIVLLLLLTAPMQKTNAQCNLFFGPIVPFFTTPSCDSNCTGTLVFDITNAAYPYEVNIDGAFIGLYSVSMPPIFNNLCGGTHFLHIVDSAGCTLDTMFTTALSLIFIYPDSLNLDVCGGNCASIYISVAGACPPFAYIWSTGETTQDLTNLCSSGNYTTTIYNACGCSATATFAVIESPCCIPDTNSYPIVCERATYTYVAPFHTGSTYQWSFTGDSIHTINNNSVTVTWQSITTAYANGSISYIETFANGSQQSHSQTYAVTPSPFINLTSSPAAINHEINICKGQSVSFLNQTTNAGNFHWDFGDGNTSNALDVSHTYPYAGTYTIYFEASTDCGCIAVDSFVVNVTNTTGPDIQCRSLVCEGDTAVYSTSAVCNNYYWSVTGGTIISSQPYSNNIQVVWNNTSGNGLVTLGVGNCLGTCTDTAYLNIPVIASNSGISGRDTVCTYQGYTYSVPFVPGTNYSWNLSPSNAGTISGNGTHEITIEFSYQALNCSLTVNYQNTFLGCTGNGAMQIVVAQQISINGNNKVCKNDSASVFAFLTGYSGQFNYTIVNPSGIISTQTFINGGFIHFLCPDTGYYSVYALPVSAALFCELPDTFKIHCVTTAPIDSISGSSDICLGNAYTYTAYGALPDHYLVWGTTGGTVLSASGVDKISCNVSWSGSPPHKLYCIQQDVDGNNCKSDTVFYTVNEVTSASINGPSTACVNGVYNYSITVPDMPAAYYEWSVTSSLASIKSGQGTKQIEVEFHNAAGTAAVQCMLKHCIAVNASKNTLVTSVANASIVPPVPVFCSGNTLNIVSSAASSYQWKDSLNSLIGTAQNITLTFGGNYSLTTLDANSCRSLLSFYVTENPSPEAILTSPSPNIFCIPTPVNVTLYAATNPGYSYQWLNNSVAIPAATSPVLNSTQTGFYQVLITNTFGCTSVSDGFPVSSQPCVPSTCTSSEFISASVMNDNCNPILFSGFASAGVTGALWNFDDPASGANNFSSLTNPTHLYSKPGYYVVVYSGTVVNLTPPPPNCGIGDTALATVLGSCDFDFEPACAGLPTQFINLSLTLPGTTVSSYTWNFGDSNSSLLENPQHVYQNAGTYTVTLTITYATCTTVSTHTVDIPGASVSFTLNPSPTCQLTPVQFTLTNNGASPLIDWQWNFGDGISSLNLDPVRAYDASGNFTAVLMVTDSKGCRDTVSQNLFVNPSPTPGIITPPGPLNQCSYDAIVLTAPAGVSYLWNDSTILQTFVPSVTGNYFVEVTDANNCIYTTPDVEVNISEPPVASIKGINEVCAGNGVYLDASGGTSLGYEWHELPSNQIVSTTGSFNYPYTTPPGTYLLYLIETDNTNSCKDTSDTLTVTIYDNPADPVIISTPSGYLCAGNNTLLEVTNPFTNGIYLWSNGQIINYDNINNPQINVMLQGNYSVIATDSAGCSAQSNSITINPPLDFSGMITGCYELCDTILHFLYGPNCMGSPQWIDISQQPPVIVSTNTFLNVWHTGIYVFVCNSPNCSDTSETIDITIIHCCPVEPPQPQITYLNDTIFSSITGSNYSYQWLLNNQIIPGANQPLLTSVSDGCYTLLVSDSNGCSTASNTLCFVFSNVVELNSLNEVIVFPNPASEILQFISSSKHSLQLSITDMNGKVVTQRRFKDRVEINISGFAEGVYAYTISGIKNESSTGKIVIAR